MGFFLMTQLPFDFTVTAANGLLWWDGSTCTLIYMYEAAWRSGKKVTLWCPQGNSGGVVAIGGDGWGCFLEPGSFSTLCVWLLYLKWRLLVQLPKTHTSIISLVTGTTLYYWEWLNDSSTPKLTQAQFHTFIIDHYIIKQEVTTTVSVQQFLDALADFPSCNCRGAPTDGTVPLQSLHYCNAPLSSCRFSLLEGKETEACRASIQNLFGHINFIFHI